MNNFFVTTSLDSDIKQASTLARQCDGVVVSISNENKNSDITSEYWPTSVWTATIPEWNQSNSQEYTTYLDSGVEQNLFGTGVLFLGQGILPSGTYGLILPEDIARGEIYPVLLYMKNTLEGNGNFAQVVSSSNFQ